MKAFRKHCGGKTRKCWLPAFSPFSPHNVFQLHQKQNPSFEPIYSLTKVFNVNQSKYLYVREKSYFKSMKISDHSISASYIT